MKVIIVGGVAGGASAAARLRRLDEDAEIILLERGEYVSYANCGLPYYIGGEIQQKSALTVQTPESLRQRLNLDVRIRQEAVSIDREGKQVEIMDLETNTRYFEAYDKLILSPGAEPIRPPFAGAEHERIFTLRNIPDTYKIEEFIKSNAPQQALIVGGGFIGLEMAENLVRAGLKVTVAEKADHVIAALDSEMAADVHHYLRQQGVEVLLENGVQAIELQDGGEPDADAGMDADVDIDKDIDLHKMDLARKHHLHVNLDCGERDVDMVLLSIGVRPEQALARDAGLELSVRGAIVTDRHLRTSDPDIYAVGDAIAVKHTVTGQPVHIPLAGPANKQGRIVADHIAGFDREYDGTQGSAIVKIFDMAVGVTGINEGTARSLGLDYDKVYLLSASHAGYYPGATPLTIKVLFENGSGRILGAQIIGTEGVDKRTDVLATAIRHQMTADDLAELELSYAPPFSSAKDPVNIIGFMIQNLLEGTIRQYHLGMVPALQKEGAQLIDVRSNGEYAPGHIEGAKNIPVDELRNRMHELDKDRTVYLNCQSGQRSYLAARILAGAGYDVKHLAGGYRLYASVLLGQKQNNRCGCC